ncbi:zinc-dependent peptidase [Flavilitoribacter nigricans]|nr:zinc-dependent peptidase [Flavilitoribacter nigricans]
MPSRIIAVPLMLLAGLFGYLTYEYGEHYTYGLVLAVVFLVLDFVFAPQINWWWWMRFPPDLPKSLHLPVEQTPFYQRLSEEDQRIFRRRVFLFSQAQIFRPQAIKEVTEDVKTAISTAAIQVNFHRLNFLYPDYENIIVYLHPFPSPQHPDHMHASELFEDEHGNGLIFSIEHVLRSFLEPAAYYNVCIHEYALLLVKTSPEVQFPEVGEEHWPALEQISGFTREKLLEYIGLEEMDPLLVAIHHYLVFRERFDSVLPDLAEALDAIFRQKPQ